MSYREMYTGSNALAQQTERRQPHFPTERARQLHQATLELMERTGLRVSHEGAREILHSHGCQVDGTRVRIPGWLVERALSSAPSQLAFFNRSGEASCVMTRNTTWYGPTLDAFDYLDPATGSRKPFTTGDCASTAALADALPNFSWIMTIGVASDAPSDISDRVIAKQALTWCQKPLLFCCSDLRALKDIYTMARVVAGDEERLLRRPNILLFNSPISPLVYDEGVLDKLLFAAEKGLPQLCYPGPQAGATAPATLAGTVIQGSAESLFGVVLGQLVNPGAPFIYGAFTTVMDMATTAFSYGAPEMNLMAYHMAELARGYGLPFFGMSGCSDAKTADQQAAAEATFSCLNAAMSGADMVHDNGWLDSATLVSPEYMVLVDEIIAMVEQYMQGIGLEQERMALEVMDRVGPGGHYLMEEHTMSYFRDIWYPRLFDRSPGNTAGKQDLTARIRERTRSLLADTARPLPDSLRREMEELASHW
ncbi:MAG: trimethylamine methyltransferase family protein [Desulfohalobiaceae bacterium]|nr:trimethylamine methyltransferase family protein [Desulfohalobiaceae bacterium]MCF8085962.1 trimethylamine methyltransferase family protein [Desulfohalobiaceae bacterium]